MNGGGASLALLGLAAVYGLTSYIGEARATSVRENALYGPASLCMGGYVVHIGAAEGAELGLEPNGSPTYIIIHREGQPEIYVNFGEEASGAARQHWVQSGALGRVIRVDTPATSGYRAGIPGEAVSFRDPAHRSYVLPADGPSAGASSGGTRPLHVSTQAFYQKGNDAGELAHFSKRLASTACYDLASLWAAPRNTAPIGYAPTRFFGPADLCVGRLMVPLAAGQQAKFNWESGKDSFSFHISGGGADIALSGASVWRDALRAGPLLSAGFTVDRIAPTLLRVNPPRGTGWDKVFTVSSQDAPLAEALIGRMEVVRRNDARCAGTSGSK
ncbi:MAG: hypothetical protein RIS52_2247 [Pseudomonadota bacterium]